MPRIRQIVSVSFPVRARFLRARLAVSLTGLVAGLLLAAPAVASAYESPFLGDSPNIGRTDMGVDVCLSPGDPVRAIGTGTVAGVMRNWYAGQPYLWYQLTGGPQAGQYVYVAEQIDHLARVGQSLRAGDVIARYAKSGSCLETGWSMADGETQAQAGTGYTDGQVTIAGISFARFLGTLGVSGQFELSAPQTQTNRATTTKRHRRHRSGPVLIPAPVAGPTPSATPAPQPTPKPKPTPALKPKPKPTPAPKPKPKPTPAPKPKPHPATGPASGPYPGPNFGPGTEPYGPAPR
ncbi:MAG: hypothetical protein NVS3B18_12810 [Candidatus Dormibacteria bacterium]